MDQPPPIQAGPRTTEFWVTVFSLLAAIAALIFHTDLSSQVQTAAALAAGLVGFGYQLSRALTKSAHTSAVAAVLTEQINAASQEQVTSPVIPTDEVPKAVRKTTPRVR